MRQQSPPAAATPGLGRFLGRSTAGAVALVLGAAGFGVLAAAVSGSPDPLFGLDGRVADRLNEAVAGRPALVAALERVTALGGAPALWLVQGALVVYLLIRRRSRLAVYAAVTGVGAVVLSPVTKELVGRLRPVLEVPVSAAGGPSYPSGHAFGSTVTYGVLLLVCWPWLSRRARIVAALAVAALLLVIGATRMALGVHYLSDVLGGWSLGAAWLAVTAAAFAGWRREIGLPPSAPVQQGLEPESAADLAPAPRPGPPPIGPTGRVAAVLATGWVLLLGVLLGLGWFVTHVLVGGPVDRATSAVTTWFVVHRTGTGDALAQASSLLGGTPGVLAVALVTAVVALAVARRWRPVVFLAVVVGGELALFLTTATVIDRTRPQVPHVGGPLPPTSSFPSGHLSAAVSVYGAVAVLVLAHVRRRLLRVLAVTAAVLLCVGIALSRLYLGVHHPLDLLGSLVLAVTWLLLVSRELRPGAGGPGGEHPQVSGR
jgi:undecaprenyl-diphosphatase